MALANTDLLIVQRPNTKTHYKLKIGDVTGTAIPDGTEIGQVLQWDGSNWVPSSVIDGGTY
jgi:hypothetical protein